MSNIVVGIVLAIFLLGTLAYYSKRKSQTILTGSVGDMFQQIEDKARKVPPSKEELRCRENIKLRRQELNDFIESHRSQITSAIKGFVTEVKSAGFTLDNICTNIGDYSTGLWIELDKEPFLEQHKGIEYYSADNREENIAFIKGKLKEWFGDKKFLEEDFRDIKGTSFYRINYNLAGLKGKTRENLGEEFFKKIEELIRNHSHARQCEIVARVRTENKQG